MKKITLILILFMIPWLFLSAGSRFHISLSGNYWMPSDDDYQTIYGKWMIYPELKLGINIYRGFYAWLGYGYLTTDGTIPIVDEPASSNQHHVSAGLGYEIRITGFMKFRIEAGSYNVYYIEKTQFIEEKGLAFGYRGDAGMFFFINKNFFMGVSAGYLHAVKTVNSNSVTFGSLMTGLTLGICF
jgi:hypothetical protein